eukprot:6247493-Prymnesium_polylepis.1
MRRARWHVQASEAVDETAVRIGGLSPPTSSLRPDMHGATVPRCSIPIGAAVALPIRLPYDDLVDLVVARLLAFECTAAARECSRVARRRSPRSRGYRRRWSA